MYKELHILIAISAVIYWYVTGHIIPAALGLALALMVHESLRILAIILSMLTIVSSFYYLFSTFPSLLTDGNIIHFPLTMAYIVLAFIRGYYTVN